MHRIFNHTAEKVLHATAKTIILFLGADRKFRNLSRL